MRLASSILKHLAIIAFLLLLVAGCAAASDPSASLKPKHKHGTLRVLYWNIQNGMWGGQVLHSIRPLSYNSGFQDIEIEINNI